MTQHAPLRIEGESIQADGCCPMCEKSFEKIENKVAILCCCTVICEACFRAFMKKSIDAEGFPPLEGGVG